MNKYTFYNNLIGWVVFFIALLSYILTIEPTASLWDCGEFIATAFKLQVGHPPGAPLFEMIARFFSLFAFGNLTKVALWINIMSALCSAFTVIFLFWTITHLVKKVVIKSNEIKITDLILVMGAGAVGALAYTYTDSAWFNAVEGEVYAMSSFFTAIVFWAILKWENVADEKFANRWIILIAYLMGLSIGVHLLNLLTIPAIVFIYYFRKFKPSLNGIIITSLISIVILGTVQYGIIQGFVSLAARFDLFFVNSIGLPFFSGVIFLVILIGGIIALGIYYSHKKNKPILNTAILCFAVILIGYTSYTVIVIRSSADTPLNENSPDNMFSLLSYLDRVQYGDRPLFYGQYFNAPIVNSKVTYTYTPINGKYEKIPNANPVYEYDPNFKTIFPRMHSHSGGHDTGYRSWANISTPDSIKPTFFDNLTFFFSYQMGFMYFRYFMWNFAGKQNDTQGYGGNLKGNWITGFSFLDGIRLGSQDNLPKSMTSNPGRNRYYLIPLLLGLWGLYFSFSSDQKNFWVIFMLFFFTGIAIVLYLNQTPYQPRERDYSYAGSFYAFAIWIGFGVLMVYEWLKKIISPLKGAIIAVVVGLSAPLILAAENWDDHDRSGRYTVRDWSINYLNSCAPNAILFTYGDNDTFPLWYVQEVEGIRTDVRVVNLSLLATDWYISSMKKKAYGSDPVPFSLTRDKYIQGKRDLVPLYGNTKYLLEEKYAANKSELEPKYEKIYNYFLAGIKKSKFPEIYKDDYQVLSNGFKVLSPVKFFVLVNNISNKETIDKLNLNEEFINNLKSSSDSLANVISDKYVLISDALKFLASDAQENLLYAGTPDESNFLPSKKFLIPVNKEKVIKGGNVPAEKINQIVPFLEWQIKRNYFSKNEMMVFDLIASNNWERPVYFATSIGVENFLDLDDYLQLEGFAYRLVPYKAKDEKGETGSVATEILYNNLINKFVWGRMNAPDVLIDEYQKRIIANSEMRETFNRLADELLLKGDKKRAVQVMDKCIEILPDNKYAFDYKMLPVIENYYLADAPEKANAIIKILSETCFDDLRYYTTLGSFGGWVEREKQTSLTTLKEIIKLTRTYKQDILNKKLNEDMSFYSILDTIKK